MAATIWQHTATSNMFWTTQLKTQDKMSRTCGLHHHQIAAPETDVIMYIMLQWQVRCAAVQGGLDQNKKYKVIMIIKILYKIYKYIQVITIPLGCRSRRSSGHMALVIGHHWIPWCRWYHRISWCIYDDYDDYDAAPDTTSEEPRDQSIFEIQALCDFLTDHGDQLFAFYRPDPWRTSRCQKADFLATATVTI